MSMRIGGLATGMDIDTLVKDLMRAERMPLDKLTQQKIWTEWQQDAYREFNLALTDLRSSVEKIRFQSNFNTYSASLSNESVLKATTNSSALPGSYSVEVEELASTAKMNSANAILNNQNVQAKSTDTIGVNGAITITDQVNNEIKVNISATMTFKQVAEEIQKATAGQNIELRANFDNTTSRFFITTKGMGDHQNFTMTFDTPELAAKIINDPTQTSYSTKDTTLTYSVSAKNAKIIFDGITIDGLTSNETTVNGLTLNLTQIGTTTVSVSTDTSKPIEAIKSFVEKYNDTIKKIEDKLIEKRYRDYAPLTDEQREAMEDKEIELWEEKARSGLLRSDPILSRALTDMRRALMDPVEGIASGNYNLLSQIGINTGNYQDGGKLTIDEDKLSKALAENPDEVVQLFTKKEGGLGITERVYQELNSVIKSLGDRAGNPSSMVDNSTISKRISEMNDEISEWQERLTKIEDRYWRQFTAMEKAINQMNQQSSVLYQSFFGGA